MAHPSVGELADQVDRIRLECERLRRSQSRWRIAAVVIGAGALGIAADSPTREDDFKEVRAERLVMIDSTGQVRGEWGTNKLGFTLFRLFDKKGRGRINLLCGEGGRADGSPMITLNDPEGKADLTMFVDADGAPHIGYTSDDGRQAHLIPTAR